VRGEFATGGGWFTATIIVVTSTHHSGIVKTETIIIVTSTHHSGMVKTDTMRSRLHQ
jgi:hypothetical protein